jgi:hypothetical protein
MFFESKQPQARKQLCDGTESEESAVFRRNTWWVRLRNPPNIVKIKKIIHENTDYLLK